MAEISYTYSENGYFRDYLDPSVQYCVDRYTSDYVVVRRKHHQYSSSVRRRDASEERRQIVDNVPAQEFEVDDTPDVSPEYEHVSGITYLCSIAFLLKLPQ